MLLGIDIDNLAADKVAKKLAEKFPGASWVGDVKVLSTDKKTFGEVLSKIKNSAEVIQTIVNMGQTLSYLQNLISP